MWNSILVYLKASARSKDSLFWLLAFPLILATLFNAMFGNLTESYKLESLDVAVVVDSTWNRNPYMGMFVNGIGGTREDSGGRRADRTRQCCRRHQRGR